MLPPACHTEALFYSLLFPPALVLLKQLPRSPASLHPPTRTPAAAPPTRGLARILYSQDSPSAWTLSRHPGPWTADKTHMANQ